MRAIKDKAGSHGPTGLRQVLLLGGAFLGIVLVVLGTRHGPAVSPDSASYIAAANSLLAGGEYRSYDGEPFAGWPPLYPTLLAVGGVFGMDPMQTVRVLHAVVFGLIVYGAGRLFFLHLREPRLAWMGFFAVLLSWPLLQVAMKAWSEPVFILVALVFIAYAPVLLDRPTWNRLAILAFVTALAVMLRYAGLALVIAGVALILLDLTQTSMRRRLQFAIGYTVMATVPLMLWLIRNYVVDSSLTGGRSVSAQLGGAAESASYFLATLTTWLIPPLLPGWLGFVLGICLIAFAGLSFRRQAPRGSTTFDRVVLTFTGAYAVFVLTASAIQAAALPDNRLLSPLYVPLVYVVLTAFDRVLEGRTGSTHRAAAARKTLFGVCAIWLLYPALSTATYVFMRASYDTNAWHESALVHSLKAEPPEGKLYSNSAWVVYLATDRYTRELPTTDIDGYLAREMETHGQPCAVVWFDRTGRGTAHAFRFLDDFFGRVASSQDSMATQGWSRAVLDFMRRSGLARRDDTRATPLDQTVLRRPPDTEAMIDQLFDDGALYVFASERSSDR